MRVILPMAGLGKRMRPHTWSKPKPLLQVAGKPVLGHILDKFIPLDLDEVVFIIGWLGEQIEDYVKSNYAFDTRFITQTDLAGQAHAIYLAKEYLHGPCMIVFVDTLFEADLDGLIDTGFDGVLYVKEVEDPRRFGVVVQEDDRVTRLIEKPETNQYRNVMVGLYYVREGRDLVDAIGYLMANNLQTKGEYYLADALQVMIDRGAHFGTRSVGVWEDCGTPETLLHTNRYLLDHGYAQEVPVHNAVLVPPVYIANSAVIENSVVGPYVTVCDDAHISGSIIRDAIVEAGSVVENMALEASLIGRSATIRGSWKRLNTGDNDEIVLAG